MQDIVATGINVHFRHGEGILCQAPMAQKVVKNPVNDGIWEEFIGNFNCVLLLKIFELLISDKFESGKLQNQLTCAIIWSIFQ